MELFNWFLKFQYYLCTFTIVFVKARNDDTFDDDLIFGNGRFPEDELVSGYL